ncbi:unnamed protein product [Hydatigera taeniaeformis]|uniref:COesterase domain-containing protein n=1 Tax=Hydatigena taeniaeformis TaxID=6205 RepID=A0A0R3WQR8_HYDTA|nr:unnamed protein product [Hydatigera taeniaeformis]
MQEVIHSTDVGTVKCFLHPENVVSFGERYAPTLKAAGSKVRYKPLFMPPPPPPPPPPQWMGMSRPKKVSLPS